MTWNCTKTNYNQVVSRRAAITGCFFCTHFLGGGYNDKSEWIVAENTHEAIIDREIFYEVQEILETRTFKMKQSVENSQASKIKEENYLKGYIRCGSCGSAVNLSQTLRGSVITRQYYCNNYVSQRGTGCDNKHRVDKQILEQCVLEAIKKLIFQLLDESKLKVMHTADKQNEGINHELQNIQRKISQANSRIANLYDDYEEGILDDTDYLNMKLNYQNRLEVFRAEEKAFKVKKQAMEKQLSGEEQLSSILKRYRNSTRLDRMMVECRSWYPNGTKGGWSTSMIARIIRDRRYARDMVTHKKEYLSFDSKKQVAVEPEDWIIVKGTHEGIVTEEEFELANANMQSTHQHKRSNPANKNNYSVICCPYCGLRLRSAGKKNKYMYCPTGRVNKSSKCIEVRIGQQVVEDTIVSMIRKQAEMTVDAKRIIGDKKKRNNGNSSTDDIMNKLRNVKTDIARMEKAKISRYEQYRAGESSREEFVSVKTEMDGKLLELHPLKEELENSLTVAQLASRENEPVFDIVKYVQMKEYDKEIAASLIEKVDVYGENTLKLTWKNQDQYDDILAQC